MGGRGDVKEWLGTSRPVDWSQDTPKYSAGRQSGDTPLITLSGHPGLSHSPQ